MIPAESFLINSAQFTTVGEEETYSLGFSLAQTLEEGSVIALSGPLGAGKTCLAKGIASGLGVEEEVTSPTYTIVSEYQGRDFPVYHIDAYRLRGSADFSSIGGEEIIFGRGISIIEWPENITDFITGDVIKVYIEICGDNERSIRLEKGKK